MRSDLDRLMTERDLQAIIVAGGEFPNTYRKYLSNGVDTHGGTTIKKRGSPPVLIVSFMEIEEAAKSGLEVMTHDDFGWDEIVAKAEGDQAKMQIGLWSNIFERFAIPPGKIGIYGVGEIGAWVERTRLLESAFPQYHLVGEIGKTIFDEAFL